MITKKHPGGASTPTGAYRKPGVKPNTVYPLAQHRSTTADCPYIQLREQEIEQVMVLAAQRNGAKSLASNKRVTDTLDDLEIHRLGFAAEVAVARYLHCEPDRRIFAHGDGGRDLEWRGLTFQVKYNTHHTGDLYVSSLSDVTSSALVLVTAGGQPQDLRIAGWIPAGDFRAMAQPKRYAPRYPEVYAIPQTRLRPMREVWKYRREDQP